MSAYTHEQIQALLNDLTRQHKAAVMRQKDLEQQLKAAQNEMAKLGFMQLGKKMMVRAELDSINKKLAANKQLQETLKGRIAAAQAKLRKSEQVPAPQAAPAAVPAPAADPAPVMESAPAGQPEAATAPAPVETPKPVVESVPDAAPAAAPRKPRPSAAPRKSVPRAEKLGNDPTLPPEEQVRKLLAHLENYYPEHQVFALDVLSAEAHTLLNELPQRCGHASPAELLAAHGWKVIPLAEGRALRAGLYTTPGEEPAVIRPKLTSVLRRMEKHYPDHVISRSIQHDHKSLAQDISSLHVWLGYSSIGAMLTAYGYRYDVPSGGRPALNVDAVIPALKAAYTGKEKPRTIAQITAEHPEYAAMLKTLQNQAPKRFGMSLRQYFIQEGLL